MTAFAAYAVVDVKLSSLFVIGHIERMAGQTLGRMRRIGSAEAFFSEDFRNTLRYRIIQDIPCTRMFVLQNPGAVLVLQNLGLLPCLYGPVACSRAAGAWTHIARFGCRDRLQELPGRS
jgi:hypothetical protein